MKAARDIAAWNVHNGRPRGQVLLHDSWSRRISDIDGGLSISKTSDICDVSWLLFGPLAAFSVNSPLQPHVAPPTFSEWVETTMRRFEHAGVFPTTHVDPAIFSLVVVPAWEAMYEAPPNGRVSRDTTEARPRWVVGDIPDDHAKATYNDIMELVIMAEQSPASLDCELFSVPDLRKAISFFNTPIWTFLRTTTATYVREPPLKPTIRDFYFAPSVPPTVDDKHPSYITTINTIYKKQSATSHIKVIAKTQADHIRCHPPPTVPYSTPPALSAIVVTERRRWLATAYAIFVDQFVVHVLNLAHLAYLNVFFDTPPATEHMLQRVRSKYIDIFMEDHEIRLRKMVIGDLETSLQSPSLAYTHPITVEELRSWLFHSYEFEYIKQLIHSWDTENGGNVAAEMTLPKRVASSILRAYARNVVPVGDIVTALISTSVTLTEPWVDGVFTEWSAMRADRHIVCDTAGENGDAALKWNALFVSMLRANGILTSRASITSFHTHMTNVLQTCVIRYMLYCFHDPNSITVSTKTYLSVKDMQDVCLREFTTHTGQTTRMEMYNTVTKMIHGVLLPSINRCSSPMRLNSILFLAAGDFLVNKQGNLPINADKLGDHESDDVFFPWYAVGFPYTGTLLKNAFAAYDRITRLTWSERFYMRWAIPCGRGMADGITYAARLDNLESQAHSSNLASRGFVCTSNITCNAQEFRHMIIHVAVDNWPRHVKWTRLSVHWRAYVRADEPSTNVFDYTYSLIGGRILYPFEIACALIMDKLHHTHSGLSRRTASIVVVCTVRGENVISTRIPNARARTVVRATCIITIPDF